MAKVAFHMEKFLVQSACARKLGCVGCLVWLRALAHTLIAQLDLTAANCWDPTDNFHDCYLAGLVTLGNKNDLIRPFVFNLQGH